MEEIHIHPPIQGADGNFCSATEAGGTGSGTVYKSRRRVRYLAAFFQLFLGGSLVIIDQGRTEISGVCEAAGAGATAR
jgi:hypothetical protein